MSAIRIEWCDYVETLRGMVPADLHPAAHSIIREWFSECRDAACHDDGAEVARLCSMITDKVDLELEWARQDEARHREIHQLAQASK